MTAIAGLMSNESFLPLTKCTPKYYDVCAAVKLNVNTLSTTRGNKYKLQKSASHYNLRKFSFCSRVVNIWPMEQFTKFSG